MKILLPFLLVACSLSSAWSRGSDLGHHWYSGTVEKAFEEAKNQNKPLFLYWGAVWCPPCNQIKKTIFTKASFQEEMKNFVSVYLDGDSARAQSWGGKLKASGYPTMLILNPVGTEIMRMPTGLTLEKYISVLRLSRANLKSISDLLALAGKGKLSKPQWNQLAFYSWEQDHEQTVSKEKLPGELKLLLQTIPADYSEEKSALTLLYLSKVAGLDKNPLTRQAMGYYQSEFFKILSDKKLVDAALEKLSFEGHSIQKFLFKKASKSAQKKSKLKLLAAMDQILGSSSYSWDERLSSMSPELEYWLSSKKSLGSKFKAKVNKSIELASAEVEDSYGRQAIMSTALWLLVKTKQFDLARNYGGRELKISKSPYYFMNYLSWLEKEAGDEKKSIGWKKKAWEVSRGSATRFQWGTGYIMALAKRAPNDGSTLIKVSRKVFSEAFMEKDLFSGRNKKRFERVSKSLSDWANNKKRKKLVSSLGDFVKKKCPKGSSADCHKLMGQMGL
jgi:thioredoxin-related protein